MEGFLYLASGNVEGRLLMKIGQTANVSKRKLGKGMSIDYTWSSKNPRGCENKVRRYALTIGVKRIGKSHDWFLFDFDQYVRIKLFIDNDLNTCDISTARPLHYYLSRAK
jgi:hypothetical protein